MVALVVFGLRRRRRGYDAAAYDDDRAGDVEYGTAADGDWPPDEDFGSEHFGFGDQFPPEPVAPDAGSTPRVSWPRGAGAAVGDAEHLPGEEGYGSDLLSGPSNVGVEEEDTDAVDTTPTPVVSQADLPKSVPISLFLSEWFRRLSFRKPLFRKQWRLKRCRPMSTLPILLTLGCRRRLYPQLKTEAGGTRPQNRRNRRVRACARQFICRSRTHTRCRTAIPSKPV